MTDPQPHLALIAGEVPQTGPQTLGAALEEIAALKDELEGLESEKASWRRKYQDLKRDRLAEAKANQWWGWAVALFWEWKVATGHLKSGWTAARFELCEPYLDRDGFPICRLAVWGIAANPATRRVTDDYEERFDAWELLFRTREHFERFANRGWAIFGRPPQEPVLAELVAEWKES